MEPIGLISIILVCGLFADGLLMKRRIKDLTDRIEDLENASRGK